MQPVYCQVRQFMRSGVPVGLLLAGSVILTLLAVASAPAVADDKPGAYRNLPIYAKDWTRVRDLPDGPARVAHEQYRQGEYQRRWHIIHQLLGAQHISGRSQDLLAKRGLGPALLGDEPGTTASKAYDGVDTLRVLIVRIAFETNREPTLTTVDPSGDFLLTPPAAVDSLFIDPPPRNRSFYQAHLAGLSEYYRFQSGGRLHIQGDVLPLEEDASYKLSDVADYGPGRDGFWSMESLERLVRDVMVTGDEGTTADGDFSFADYDDNNPFTYIIFVHAGSDWQSDVYGDSPNDIPTFFVQLGTPQDLPASGGSLSECSIIPETTNQDDSPGSIAAAFYHEFGHALGLVDVYNTRTGLPQVGLWDLMDSGTNLPVTLGHVTADNDTIISVATGVLPPSLSVWNKWFLGWIDVDLLQGTTGEYTLPAIQVPRNSYYYGIWSMTTGDFLPMDQHPQAYQAGLSAREYFLVENRYVPPAPSATTTFTPYDGLAFERDEATGVIQYLAGLYQGTWSNSGLYDYFMPAGGLLVWHVNMDRIEPNLADNTINAWGDGLRLVEADGIQDIGVLDAYVMGWYGSDLDAFTDQHELYDHQDLYADDFPSSRNFDRSWSGFSLSNVRRNQPENTSVMRFGAGMDPLVPGFPYEARDRILSGGDWPGPRGVVPGSAVTLTTNTGPVLIFAESVPETWAGGDFTPALIGLNTDGTVTWFDRFINGPHGAFQFLNAPLAGNLARQDLPGGEAGILWGTVRGQVGVTRIPPTGDPEILWSRAAGDSLVHGPLPLILDGDNVTFCLLYPDTLALLDDTGADASPRVSLSDFPGASGALPVTAPRLFQVDGQPRVAIVTAEEMFILAEGGSTLQVQVQLPLARSLVDGEVFTAAVPMGRMTWLTVFDSDGLAGTWQLDGLGDTLPGAELDPGEPLVCEPAVADLDGDGGNDLILATATRIHARHSDGLGVRGFPSRLFELFPLPDTTRISGPVVVADATGNGVNDIFYVTDGGHLVGLGPTGKLMPRTPFRFGDRQAAGLAIGTGPTGDSSRVLWLTSTGGYVGPPLGRQQVNGRVSAYGLADVSNSARTSEWLGAAGGSLRSGPVGDPAELGDQAPIAAEVERVVLYPNPAPEGQVVVRFHSAYTGEARFELFTIQGEPVVADLFSVTAGTINEHQLDISGLVSGLYLGRLTSPTASGHTIRTMTLAVER